MTNRLYVKSKTLYRIECTFDNTSDQEPRDWMPWDNTLYPVHHLARKALNDIAIEEAEERAKESTHPVITGLRLVQIDTTESTSLRDTLFIDIK